MRCFPGRKHPIPVKIQLIALATAAAGSLVTYVEHKVVHRRVGALDRAPGEVRLRYPFLTRLTAATVALGAPPLAASLAWEAGAGLDACLVVSGVLALAGFLLTIEAFGSRVVVGTNGVIHSSPWAGDTAIEWDDVERVHWTPALRTFEIRSVSGTTVRASAYLAGMPTFARAVLAELPGAARATDRTRRALTELAS